VRIAWPKIRLFVFVGFLLRAGTMLAFSQNPDTLMPDQSAAKAKQLLQQMIEALGGPRYLAVRERGCDGRLSQFEHNGDLAGFILFKDYWRYPDKNRTEYEKPGNRRALAVITGGAPITGGRIINVFAGDKGWTLDKGGITEQPESAIAEFQEKVKRNIDNLLRLRLNEEGMFFRYGGDDIVDLKQVDWVEIVDRDKRTFRIAIDRSTHFPLRGVVRTRDPETRETVEEVTYYSDFHAQDGVQTPLQITRERDGRKIYQAFFEGCKYNTNLGDLFNRASLESSNAASGKKKKNK
jgi:hypothetical protein